MLKGEVDGTMRMYNFIYIKGNAWVRLVGEVAKGLMKI